MQKRLVDDLKTYGVALRDDANDIYGQDVVEKLHDDSIIKCAVTPMGDILYLTYRGRVKMGFKGGYKPKDQALMNAAFLRKVEENLVDRLGIVPVHDRKQSFSYELDGKRILVLARQNGYTNMTVRRIYREFIMTDLVDEIHFYYYDLNAEEINYLKNIFFMPQENKTILSEEAVKLYSIDPDGYKLKEFSR